MLSTEILIALISSCVALLMGIVSLVGQHRINVGNRNAEAEKAAARYREPLMAAAADLQSRLFNILKCHFFDTFYARGNERERSYVINNTVFLFAQFFAWTEAVREEIQFIDLKDNKRTRELSRLQGDIYSLVATDQYGTELRVFAGEQRAIGEHMLAGTNGRRCIGYGEFLNRAACADNVLFRYLIADVTRVAEGTAEARKRMVALQGALIDLLDHLDPEHIRYPKKERAKVGQ